MRGVANLPGQLFLFEDYFIKNMLCFNGYTQISN